MVKNIHTTKIVSILEGISPQINAVNIPIYNALKIKARTFRRLL